jgi:two-component system, NarL family, response regulator DevR
VINPPHSNPGNGSSTTESSVRLVIAHPLPLLRRALRLRIADEPDIDIVGEVWSPEEAADLVRLTHVDVALIGLGDDSRLWLEACSTMAALGSRVLVVADDLDPTATALAARAGAEGFLMMSSCGLSTVVTAVKTLARGEAWIPRSLVGPLLRELIASRREDDATAARFARLSSREREVLTLLVEGLDQRQIGARLTLSPHTARTHIQRVLEKLEVHSRFEAVAMALSHSLIERFGLTNSIAAPPAALSVHR